MIKITIENLFEQVLLTTNNSQTVLSIIHENKLDWMHACGAKGRCTTCRFQILSGKEHLKEPTVHEQKFSEAGRLNADERLACQSETSGDIRIRIPQDCKLPHIKYSD